ncbi:MAG: T9SS type A sorting domain-containing protein [Candidatus Shapirobacteria bacterium]
MKKITLVIIVLGIGINNLYSQWTQTEGPLVGSNAMTVFEHDSNYFSTAYLCGFYSKSSMEDTWNMNSDIYFDTFTIIGDSLFVSAYRFSDGLGRDLGIQLFDLNNLEAEPITIYSLRTPQALNHSDSYLFGGHEREGFFKLSFDGTNCEYYNDGLPADLVWDPEGNNSWYETNVTAIEISDNYVFCGTNHGVYRCDTDFNPWIETNSGLIDGNVTFIEEIHDTLYTSIGTNLYFSINEGNSWGSLYAAASKITCFQKKGNRLFISTSNSGLYTSIDNGASWNSMNSGLTDLAVNTILVNDSSIFCGTNSKGVLKYDNNVWLDDNSGIVCSFVRDISNTNSNIVAISDGRISIYSNNTYNDITPVESQDGFYNIVNMGDTIFVTNAYVQSTYPFVYQFIYYSYNSGNTWTEIGDLPYTYPWESSSHTIYIDNNRIYGSSGKRMFYSDDLGVGWTDISLPSVYCNDFNDFLVYNSTPYATTCGGGQLLILDNTNNWILNNNGLPSNYGPLRLAYCDNAIFTYLVANGMYVSHDNGSNWNYAGYGLNGDDYGIRDFAYIGDNIFVSTANGIFVTSNFGQNWYECNDGLKNLNTRSLALLNDTLYVGTYGSGIWKRGIEEIGVSINNNQYNKYEVKIYPNPVIDYFSVKPPLDNSGEIQIFDIMGKNILTRSIETSENINVSNIKNGAYLVIIRTKENITTHKLIINK